VLAKSFARIHLDNLVNSGIPPVTFADPKAYDGIQQGDRLRITNVLAAIRTKARRLRNLTRGTRAALRVSLRPYQREYFSRAAESGTCTCTCHVEVARFKPRRRYLRARRSDHGVFREEGDGPAHSPHRNSIAIPKVLTKEEIHAPTVQRSLVPEEFGVGVGGTVPFFAINTMVRSSGRGDNGASA